MRNKRRFSLEFKRRVIEELLSGEGRAAQVIPGRSQGWGRSTTTNNKVVPDSTA
jgi:hypothetical protein